ncbi:MAG: CNNM domain-containing protein [Planctomycetota bacterium]
MILLSVFILFLGVFLSAFFSGNETGFYRASRVRFVLAALDGDRVSNLMIKLINNPTLFVATTLIGNNVANYLTSLAIVLFTKSTMSSSTIELIAPVAMSPLIFVYGELLPKNLFFQAPNYLLRFCAPLFLLFTCIFAPAAAMLWVMGRLLESLLGESPEKIRLTLARQELQKVLEEGMEAGILHPTQRLLGQNFFDFAAQPVVQFCTPLAKLRSISVHQSRESALRFAKQKSIADIPVYQTNRNNVIGYVRTVDLLIDPKKSPKDLVREFTNVSSTELFGEAILQLHSSRKSIVRVVGPKGRTIGLLRCDQLTDPLLQGPLGSFRR